MDDNLPPTFESMAQLLEKNPLKAIRTAQKFSPSVDRIKYELAAIAYGYAAILRGDMAQRENFYEESFWDNRERAMRSGKLLLHVFTYVYGSDEGGPFNRASEHSRALQAAFDGKKPFEEIPQYIEDSGGFYGLLKSKKKDERDSSGLDQDAPETPSRPSAKTVTKPDTVAEPSDDDEDSDDQDVEPSDLDDDEVRLPVRKVPKPEAEQPGLKLLPRESIAAYTLIRHPDPTKNAEIRQALKDGKRVTAELSKGNTSGVYELYAGGGSFFDVIIVEAS